MVKPKFSQAPEEPEIFPDLELVVEGFWRLSNARGANPDPISMSDLIAYHQYYATGVDQEEFLVLVQTMDKVFLDHSGNKLKREQERASHGRRR
ncbi:MAG: hypothetical protein GY927_07635 [bacterium]|nr:hypothetical protein [bacterium]